ncbi:hypothetical protein [Bradyrhizobium japonicum]|uniref:hypothetical protein n=1 Tax=Bradyrhizobium japonicum TaxID=375 RepID=UPI001BADD7D6|nr:hypothetical protein [Bradyrhizobium japonicum]MBR0959861.1 hypothetical protein [Bradyrhizobium japonicum]
MTQLRGKNFRNYAAALRGRESSGDYSIINKHGYAGAYQFGRSALIDAGFIDRKGQWTPYAASLGVNSLETFRSNPAAQDTAFQNLVEKNWDYLRSHMHYVGQTVGGIPITVSGLLAGAHLVGASQVKQFLDSGGVTVKKDGNGTPVTEYLKKFAGYDFAFDTDPTRFGGLVGGQALGAGDGGSPKSSDVRVLRRVYQAPVRESPSVPSPSFEDRWGTFGDDSWRRDRPALTYGLGQRSDEDRMVLPRPAEAPGAGPAAPAFPIDLLARYGLVGSNVPPDIANGGSFRSARPSVARGDARPEAGSGTQYQIGSIGAPIVPAIRFADPQGPLGAGTGDRQSVVRASRQGGDGQQAGGLLGLIQDYMRNNAY